MYHFVSVESKKEFQIVSAASVVPATKTIENAVSNDNLWMSEDILTKKERPGQKEALPQRSISYR